MDLQSLQRHACTSEASRSQAAFHFNSLVQHLSWRPLVQGIQIKHSNVHSRDAHWALLFFEATVFSCQCCRPKA